MSKLLTFHEYANIFPLMDDASLEELKGDIEKNDLREPGVLCEGKILDGRNRYLACQRLGKEMAFEEANGDSSFDALAYVISKNLQRRHLDSTQRAMVAARVRGIFDERAKKRQRERKGNQAGAKVETLPHLAKARDEAGEAFGVSGKQVDKASKVLLQGAEPLVEACDRGEVSLNAAEKFVAAVPDKRVQAKVVAKGKKAVIEATKRSRLAAKRSADADDEYDDDEGVEISRDEEQPWADAHDGEWSLADCIVSLRREVKRWRKLCPDNEVDDLKQVLRDLLAQLEETKP